MKKLLLLLILIISFSSSAQQNAINLKWNISDTLTYKTIIKDTYHEDGVDENKTDSLSGDLGSTLREMRNKMAHSTYESKLFPDEKGNIDILINAVQTDSTDSFFSKITKMTGVPFLRGKVSPEGELLSFYYKREHKNMTSLLFELPNNPMEVGDEWNLNINLISLDQNFYADTLQRKNIARLKDIIIKNGNRIAVIEYNVQEYVSGTNEMTMKSMFPKLKDKKVNMKTSYTGTGEFDIDDGYWISYDGTMETDTDFSLFDFNTHKTTEFKLTLKK
ncbi:MAG: hypothetical protein R6V36_06550 [Psychroflexus sp.]